MLTNERVQALINTDREALVELMALARRTPFDVVDGFDSVKDITLDSLLTDVEHEMECDSLTPDAWKRAIRAWNNAVQPAMELA